MNIFTNTVSNLTFVFIFLSHLAFSANVAIIESTSFHPLQNMDAKWKVAAENLGHTATILTQTTLDDLANLNDYDVLILSNGLITLTDTRIETISQFIAQGKNAYIQSEYQVTRPGNKAFEYAVTQMGADFSWDGEGNGDLSPMQISGELAEGDNPVSTINYFWYGAFGSGDTNFTPFLEHNNKHYGFTFCSPNPNYGKIITTSDQDWIRKDITPDLVHNMMHFLASSGTIDIPSIFVTVSNNQPCENEPLTFTANVGTTTATVAYQWLVNGVEVPNATDASYTSIFQNEDLVNCEITFSDGCDTETIATPMLEVLVIFPLTTTPTITISTTNTSICMSQAVTAEATPSDLTGLNNATLQWTLNGQNILGATNSTLTLFTLNDGDVLNCIIQYDDLCNGSSQINSNDLDFTVNTNTTPILTIFSDLTNICAGEPVDFQANAIDAGTNPSYLWMVDGNPVGSNASSFNTSDLVDGQTVTCIVTSSNACATTPTATSNTITLNITTPLIPELSVQADQSSICLGETITFYANGTNLGSNAQFEWLVDGISTSTTNNTFTTNTLTNGQTVTCQVSVSEACVTTNTLTSTPISIEVNSPVTPTLSISSNVTSICYGGTVSFTASGQNLGANPQYQWLVDGTLTGNNSATLNTIFTNEQTISCIVTATNTCSGTLTANSNDIAITLTDLTLVVVDVQAERCANSNGLIQLEAMGGQAPYTFNWDNNTINTNELTNLSAGDYSVVVTDVNGCSADLEINIPFEAVPEITTIESTDMNCTNLGGSATVIMDDPNGSYFYTWKNENNETVGNASTVNNLAEGMYFVEVLDLNGCMVSEEIFIDAQAPLLVKVLDNATIQLGEELQLEVLTNAPNPTFSWRADESLSCDNCISPTIKPTNTTTYHVTVTTPQGCSATAQVTVQVEKPRNVFVPNAFSPNSDGENDRFTIYGGSDVAKVKNFKVFDRWGSVVYSNEDFQVNDESQGWDGNFNNKKIATGVFIYFAEVEFIDGRVEVYKGDVTTTK